MPTGPAMPPIPPITQALLLINVAMYCIDLTMSSSWSHGWLALWPLDSGNFMPWQVVSYAFMHGSFNHLFFNMLGLWMFGAELERIWGRQRFIQFYAASVLTAAACQLLVGLSGHGAPTVGASGGLFGLLLAFGMMFPNRVIMLLIPPIPMKAKYMVAGYGAIELALGLFETNSGIAHFAHLGGMLGGWLMMRYWRGQPPFGGMGKPGTRGGGFRR